MVKPSDSDSPAIAPPMKISDVATTDIPVKNANTMHLRGRGDQSSPVAP